jgi:hypothetical protein
MGKGAASLTTGPTKKLTMMTQMKGTLGTALEARSARRQEQRVRCAACPCDAGLGRAPGFAELQASQGLSQALKAASYPSILLVAGSPNGVRTCRSDSSLGELTKKFLKLVHDVADGILDLNKAAETLSVSLVVLPTMAFVGRQLGSQGGRFCVKCGSAAQPLGRLRSKGAHFRPGGAASHA